MRVLESRRESSFLLKTRNEDGVFCQMSMNTLDYRLPREAARSCLFGQEHLGHTARTEGLDQFVATPDDFVHITPFSQPPSSPND
jgi:hypothetical protein